MKCVNAFFFPLLPAQLSVSVSVCVHAFSRKLDYCPDFNPVTPPEDVLKNGSADNALPLV